MFMCFDVSADNSLIAFSSLAADWSRTSRSRQRQSCSSSRPSSCQYHGEQPGSDRTGFQAGLQQTWRRRRWGWRRRRQRKRQWWEEWKRKKKNRARGGECQCHTSTSEEMPFQSEWVRDTKVFENDLKDFCPIVNKENRAWLKFQEMWKIATTVETGILIEIDFS